ncbi:uncharacterized protein LOC116039527 [Sander lucioperca]|uniref:uncharacterized protein LOC116039527 n=1 Tax=Sander lucioperca TaxID=283035 RepID=UPI00125D2787|nr:uncharacterized protein LOC116039527 [Sander lucioperca]XP_031140220.1 uncharacterized protein LOC116039527 [Sander lucioperca]
MFHIVIFESTNEVEVVPAIWVKDNTCMWPPYKHDEIVKAVRSQEPTGPHWIPYKVRKILSKATYEEARVKLPEAERFTDLTDSEDSPKRKRRRLKKNPIREDDDSDSERLGPFTLPSPPDLAPVDMLIHSLPLSQSLNAGSSGTQRTDISQLCPERRCNRTPAQGSRVQEDVESLTGRNTPSLASNDHSSNLIDSRTKTTPTRPRNTDFSESVIRTILTNQEVIKEQMGILVKLVYDLKGTAEESSSLPLETFPMASLHDLQVLEGQLQDQEFKKNLTTTLTQRGGTAVKDTVWRMMGFLLTNQVARQLNWKGVNGKGAFKTLTLKGVINEAVRRNRLTATSTDQEVEQWVKRWLHLAGDRDGGRRARQRATNNLV